MNKDCQLIFEAYRGSPKFKVGDWVRVCNVDKEYIFDDKEWLGSVGKIIKIVEWPNGRPTYNVESPKYENSMHIWYQEELESFNINVKDEDKPTAADLLDI